MNNDNIDLFSTVCCFVTSTVGKAFSNMHISVTSYCSFCVELPTDETVFTSECEIKLLQLQLL